ncbi:hypothetical protein L6V77_12545 [Myxococcota bacterium]|nr:hypothetical protein [Myxococcota bacterium]
MPALALLLGSALLLAAPKVAAPPGAKAPPAPKSPFDLRHELRSLVASTPNGHVIVRVLDDGSRLTVDVLDGKVAGYFLEPAKGTPEGVFNFDRNPNPKDKRECAVLLARSAFTVAYTVDCVHLPPLPR